MKLLNLRDDPQPLSEYRLCLDDFKMHHLLMQFSVDHYITAHQKNRPILFSTPLVVPCVGSTPRRALYECVWTQVKRLIIPDPPNKYDQHYIYEVKVHV